jgi:hypothetical protein
VSRNFDEGSATPKLPVTYEVGYGRPPVDSRFRKGQSGNPKGRPKGARAKPKQQFDPAERPTDRLILEEAYRPVTIREGDKVIELPAIQAAMRALAISAMKGSRLSQKALAEITQTAEARQAEERLTAIENALEYKQKWTAEIERCRRLGIEGPGPLPHPDDVIIDWRSGQVRTEGPLDEREKQRWDKSLARRADAQAEVTDNALAYKRAKTDGMREIYLREWIAEQYIFDLINDAMPDRYKAKLENRLRHPDASREGTARETFHKMRPSLSPKPIPGNRT